MRQPTVICMLSIVLVFDATSGLAHSEPAEKPDVAPPADPNSTADANDIVVVELSGEAARAKWLAEAVRWPSTVAYDTFSITKDPNVVARATRLMGYLIREEQLPNPQKVQTHFLKGWRSKDRESLVAQWTKG